ncbi:hypothetical protein V2G26_000266 [Clonostachys chloroleuca]
MPPAKSHTDPPRSKKRRINFACNYCRARKTRCDERKPSCNACQAAGVHCITTDKRRPGKSVDRHEAGRQHRSIPSVSDDASPANQLMLEDDAGEQPMSHSHRGFSTTLEFSEIGNTIGNSSVEMANDWLDLALYRLGLCQGPTKTFELRRADIMNLSDASLINQWELPNQKECMASLEECLDSSFFEYGQRNGPPQMLQILAVLVLGYISGPHQISNFDVRSYLNRCRTMLGHVMRYPSIATLKSLILFSLALKSSNELLEAWHTVNLAAQIAASLGLNQRTTRSWEPTSLEYPVDQQKKRLWVYVYTVEKLLAFELGRQSNLGDIQEAELPDTLGCKELFELARLLSDIGKWSVRASRQEDETDRDDELYQSICEKVKITGESCIKLIQWAESMPDEFRPTSDSIYNSRLHPVASYISMQYHSAIIILSRNSLLISKEALQSAVGVIAKDKPWYSVIRNGQSMVADAARKTLRLVIEGVDSDFNAALSSLTAPLNSLATLVVSIITRPLSHVAGTDLSLIETAASALRELHCWNIRGNNDLGSLLDRLVRLSSDSIKAARHSIAAASSIGASEGRIPSLSSRHEPRSDGPDQTVGMSWPVTGSSYDSQDELQPGSLFGDGSQLRMLNDDDPMWFDNWTSTFPDEISWDWSNFPQIFQSRAQSNNIQEA